MGKPATNPAAQDKLRRREKQRAEQHAKDVKALADNAAFRRWVWRTTESLNVHGYTGVCDARAHFHEGRRSAGVDMLAELRSLAPDAYALMVAEQMAALADEHLHRKAAEAAAENEDP